MTNEQKKIVLRILLCAALLLAALLVPLRGIWRLTVFLLPYLIIGWDVIWEAAEHLLHGKLFDEEFLMTVATVGAFVLGEYTEAVAVMLFYQIGELLQDIAIERSRTSVTALMKLRPDTASVMRNGTVTEVPVEDVSAGELLTVRPGECVPLDGILTEGTTSVDTSALTGESLPRDLNAGDTVLSGSVNLTGSIRLRVTGTYRESTVARILALMEQAADRKSRSENFITKFSKIYTPCVVIGALLLALIPSLIIGNAVEWIRRALIFLVVSCPCALVISVPLTFFAGIGGASGKGILIKGSEYLETLAALKTVVFDKTGTLTRGSFSVSAVHPVGISEEELLTIAAAAESASTHPLAVSIVSAAPSAIDRAQIGAITEHPGLGVEAVIGGTSYFVGSRRFIGTVCEENDLPLYDRTAVYVAQKGRFLGSIVMADEIKISAKEAIKELDILGITKTVMLTGDRKEIAEQVAEALQISQVFAELLPAEKVSQLEQLLSADGKTAFVGDGINDAPVLMRADVGIAMGALGSDAAMEAADVVLMDDDLQKLPIALKIARKTMRIVRENIAFALLVKLAVLLLSALGVFRVFGMWIAVFADVGVTVLAALNALRAFSVRSS